jgi:hypothetical protein
MVRPTLAPKSSMAEAGFGLGFAFGLDFFFAGTGLSFGSNKQIMAWRSGPVNEPGTRLDNTDDRSGRRDTSY